MRRSRHEAGICESWSDDDDSGVDTSEAWFLSVEGNDKPADAEFLSLDSACEEHTVHEILLKST